MTYNFDKTIDRAGTGAVKLDLLPKLFGRSDLLPLWVADMDFETPTFIVDALNPTSTPKTFFNKFSARFRPSILATY